MGKDSVEETAIAKDAEISAATGGSNAISKAGGAYIPPARLRMMQQNLAADKSSEAYQRANWERLKRKIHGQINRLNVSNIVDVARTLLRENLMRGRFVLSFLVLWVLFKIYLSIQICFCHERDGVVVSILKSFCTLKAGTTPFYHKFDNIDYRNI